MQDIVADDRRWMQRALRKAREGSAAPGCSPIGAVIVRNGVLVAEAYNEVDLRFDATAHAEIVAIRRAGTKLGCTALRGTTLYSTLQPCGMCSMAAIWAKIGRIVYGAGRSDVHDMYFEDRHLQTIDFIRDAYRDDLALSGGVLAAECAALYVAPGANIPPSLQFNR